MTDEFEPDLDTEDPRPEEARAREADPSTALVQVADGFAVLYGDHVPAGMDLIPFTFVDQSTQATVSNAITQGAGFANLVAQGVHGSMQAQGLVRLAPETIEALKSAVPVVKDGWNLGTLTSQGKYVHQIRWLPAGGATAVSVVASWGPALAMMAIQYQLSQVADLAEHNLELTSKVLQVVRQEQWSAVTGYHNTLVREFGHAREIGAVTDSIYKEIRGYQGALASQWDVLEKAVNLHVVELRSRQGSQERQQYLTDHGEAILADVQALLMAQTSWFIYQAMRAGHLLNAAGSSRNDEALLKKLVADVQSLHEQTLNETDWLLERLAREFAIISELAGKRRFMIGGSNRSAKDVSRMVRQLQAALAAVRGTVARSEPEPPMAPTVRACQEPVPPEFLRILGLRLEQGETLLGIADASLDQSAWGVWSWPGRDAGWVAVTDRRVLIAKQDAFRRLGAIDRSVALDDIRYVRLRDRDNNGPHVDVVTKEANLTLEFAGWAKEGTSRSQVGQFGELLASFMRLPATEIPSVRIPELEESPAKALPGAGWSG